MDRSQLEAMPTPELHERALEQAKSRVDVAFVWRLLRAVPAAQAATGNVDEAETDIASLSSLLSDAFNADAGEVGEALRPLYIEYLAEHA